MTDDLVPRVAELRRDAQKVLDHATEAEEHLKRGDLQALADVVGLLDYPLGDVRRDADGVLATLHQSGIHPGSGD
ncbi:hypothetical protein [Kribbella caucasensis]|uniref:hypothetical protein n=1 Tax=Kribbella caucasensis TaxID=2512215 RepID=UPI00105FEB05|nr:hypothetical protein [Kribbella sp. VKM Ac-2527]